jgi:hypothetical protein
MKHTPGPWEAVAEPTEDGFGRVLYFDIRDSSGKTIADTANSEVAVIHEEDNEDGHARWDEQGKADAILIAAAPDMLAALKGLIEDEDISQGFGGLYAHLQKIRRNAIAAVAKAEGQS